jgi:hypothetical protein
VVSIVNLRVKRVGRSPAVAQLISASVQDKGFVKDHQELTMRIYPRMPVAPSGNRMLKTWTVGHRSIVQQIIS